MDQSLGSIIPHPSPTSIPRIYRSYLLSFPIPRKSPFPAAIAKRPHRPRHMSTSGTVAAPAAAAAAALPAGDVVFYVFALLCIVAIVLTLVCLYLRCGYSLLRDQGCD